MSSYLQEWRRDAGAWLRMRGLELWVLIGIWMLVTMLIYLLAVGHESPRRYQDEFLFWALAKNFAAGDGLTWRGVGLGMKSWLYPVMLAPAFWIADSVPGQYTLVHLGNSLMISFSVVPGYLLGRLYFGRLGALTAALMVVSVPAMNYAGVIATENLGYPAFTAACGAIVLALARPRPRNALLAFGVIAVAVLTRTQFVVLFPVLGATLLLAAAMQGPGRRKAYLTARTPLWGGLIAVALLGGLMFLGQGKGVFGLYAGAFDGVPLKLENLWFWVKAFTADVYLLAAIVPVIATLAIFGRAENRRDPLVGALIALALIASLALIAQVSWFSATNPYDWRARHIFYERYMFYLGPLFFVGLLVAWQRVSWKSALVSAGVATVIVSGFQSDALMVPFSYDSFGLSLIGRHAKINPAALADIGMLLARITLVLGAVYVISTLPSKQIGRLLHGALIAFTFAALLVSQGQTWHYARLYSAQAFEQFPKPANFIDKNTKSEVGMIVTSTDDPLSYFTTEFWNSRVTSAWASDAPPIKTPVMYSPTCDFAWAKDGRIVSEDCSVPTAWYLRSTTLTMHLKDEFLRVHPTEQLPMLTLMEGKAPARILALIDGRQARGGLVQSGMNLRTFLDGRGEARLKLTGAEQPAVVSVGGRSVDVPAGRQRSLMLPVAADEVFSVVNVRTAQGLPGAVFVTNVEIREGDGEWQTIL